MGRLQRKKNQTKRKKKKKNIRSDASVGQKSESAEKNVLSLTGFSRDIQKSKKPPPKKISEGVKPAKQKQGKNFLARSLQFLREVRIELKKVTWPTRKQTMGSTVVVIILVVIISLFLGLVDFGLSHFVSVVLR